MPYQFTCPHCQAEMTTQYLAIGEKAMCIACGQSLSVPETAIEIMRSTSIKPFSILRDAYLYQNSVSL